MGRMRRSAFLLTAIAVAGCAGSAASGARSAPSRSATPADPSTDYRSVSRALTEIDAAERQGDMGEELRWAQAAERAPQDAAAQFLAVAAQPAGEHRWDGFRDLSLQFPGSALPFVGMASTYLSWRTFDQAERAIGSALGRDPACFLAVGVRAELAEARGRPEEALADYGAVLRADPKNPEAHLGLARLARARGDLEEAHAQAAAALEETRTLPGAWAILGEIAVSIGEPEAAIDFYRGAIEQSPRDRAVRVSLARLLSERGQHAAAVVEWQAATELKEDPESLSALAEQARAAGDLAAERRALERLAQLRPSADEWKRVAEIRFEEEDYAGAERAYQRMLEARPRDPDASLGMARVHLARGESLEAVEALRNAGPAGQGELEALGRRLNLEKLSRGDVTALQKAVQAQVDRTYRARLLAAPSLSGNLRLRVTVDGSESATAVEVLEDSVHDPDVRACAYWNLHDASYPPGFAGRYTFAFAFQR